MTSRLIDIREIDFGFSLDVMNVNRLPVDHGATCDRAPTKRQRAPDWNWSAYRHSLENIAIHTKDRCVFCFTQPRCILGYGV